MHMASAGTGYADVVYLPKTDSGWPALVIELKWNKTAEAAIDQILKNNYPSLYPSICIYIPKGEI